MKQDRVFYVDALRAYAIFWVVASHVFAAICWAKNSYPLPVWGVFNVLDSVIRLCVPTFLMISGKLLLGSTREESYLHFIGRRYAKLVPPFFAWFMIDAYYEAHSNGVALSPSQTVLHFLQGTQAGHLYFMYIILGVYLLAPMMRAYVRSVPLRDVGGMLGLWMGFLIVQFFFPDYIGSGPATTLIDYGGYFLAGYFFDRIDFLRGKSGALFLSCLAVVLFNAGATYLRVAGNGGTMDETFYNGTAPLVAVYTGLFFLLLKQVRYDGFLREGSIGRRAVTWLSLESYNVYLVHMFILLVFADGSLGFVLNQDTGPSPFIGVPLTTVAILAGSLILSLLLKRIPYLSALFVIP